MKDREPDMRPGSRSVRGCVAAGKSWVPTANGCKAESTVENEKILWERETDYGRNDRRRLGIDPGQSAAYLLPRPDDLTGMRPASGLKVVPCRPIIFLYFLMMRDGPVGSCMDRREAVVDAFASSRFSDALRRAAWTTGTAAFQGFRTSSRTPCDAPHRRDARSWPKTLESRPYGSLSPLLGIRRRISCRS